ncbi:gas vesicle protein GvpJ [Halomarina oriensis]|uniref:Gas vesicle protein n=1 Tax=Halomarina oriensis TaxID=671145 RepID=A0A6B0GMX8_9EURY|nr:gas vesicle protein GvpJ [Halomarina oriensis]MWG36020.1 gas vesicle protein [Halomarina oriensis]
MPEPTRSAGPTRQKDSLADVVELLLDKGIVINADIAVSVGETELLGVHIRAAIASFETAAQYGLQFPDGTDAQRVQEAAGVEPLEEGEDVGDAAPISVRGPRGGAGERPRATGDEDEGEGDLTDAVEDVGDAAEDAVDGDDEAADSADTDETAEGDAPETGDDG